MPLITNLISHWKLDEVSGNALDAHDGNHLTDNNTVTSATGKIALARDFESTNLEFLSITDNDALSGSDRDITIAAWVKAESLSGTNTIVAKYGTTGNQREYWLRYDSGTFTFLVSGDGSTSTTRRASAFGAATLGQWYLVIAWHDSVNDIIGISVNNSTAETTSHTTGILNGTSPFGIGARQSPNADYWDGLIDEVSIWNKVLTSDERTQLYNSGNGFSYPFFNDSDFSGPNMYFLDGTGMYGTDTTNYTTIASGNNVLTQVKDKWKGAYRGSLSGGFGGVCNLAPGRWLSGTYSLALIGSGSTNSFMTIGLPKTFGYDSSSTVAEQSRDSTMVFGFAVKSLSFSVDNQAPSFDGSLDDPQHWITIFDDYGRMMMVITLNTSGVSPLKVYACHPGNGSQLAQAECTISTTSFDYFEIKIKFSESAGEVVVKQNGTELINYSGTTYYAEPKKARSITFGTSSVADTARWQGQYTDFYVADGFVYSGHTSRVWVKQVQAQGMVKQWANNDNGPSNHTYIDDNPVESGNYIYPSQSRRTIDTYALAPETGIGLIHGVAMNMGMTNAGATPVKAVWWKVDSETVYPFSGYILGTPNYQVIQHINARIPYNEFWWKARDLGSGVGNLGLMYNE